MSGEIVGYARTSTSDQKAGLAAQIEELKAAGCSRVYAEQISSLDANRPQLSAALSFLREGDQFVVTRPDRLARNTIELLKLVNELTSRGVVVKLLSMGVDTATATGTLFLTMMAGVAAFERELMLERQRAGIAAAKAAGRYKGRKPTAKAQSGAVIALLNSGKRVADIQREIGVSRASVYRIVADHRRSNACSELVSVAH